MIRSKSETIATGDEPFALLLASARGGSTEALGRLLEECRQYLLLVASAEIEPALSAKLAASDLVQETFLEAQQDFPRFQGASDAELLAWLRRILLHNLCDAARRYRDCDKRAIGREVPLAPPVHGPRPRASSPLAKTQTPSWLAMRHEGLESVTRALDQLSDESRQVIVLHNLSGLSFVEIGKKMSRSADAVRKLWARAIRRLEGLLDGPDLR